jgi:hypothetical protein
MEQKTNSTVVRTSPVPTHGNWEEERSFGQQTSSIPQKQYELYPAKGQEPEKSDSK